MSDDAPTFRPEARIPRGLQDRRARDLAAERAILDKVTAVYRRYGFEHLETSAFEYADALGKFLPDSERPNEGVFALQDDDEQWMALRYDLTAPLARFAAQNWDGLPKPFRRYAFGTVWRNEKPGPGRYREFVQCDADTVGSARPEADAEIVAMAVEGLEAAGLARGQAVMKLNHRKLLDGLLVANNIVSPPQQLVVLRAMDKFDRLGVEGVRLLLGPGRRDESGAFTIGAQISSQANDAITTFLERSAEISFSTGEVPEITVHVAANPLSAGTSPVSVTSVATDVTELIPASHEGEEGWRQIEQILSTLKSLGVTQDQARFDPSVVRGLEYYTGAVFEAELLLETTDEHGREIRFGSIGGGGRYDDLVARFTGQPVPATGFSFGVSRLAAALRAAGREAGDGGRGPVVVIAFSEAHMADYFAVANELRRAGIPAEVYLGSSGMRPQMKYADRRLSPAAVIIGDDERAAGTVTVKDLDLGRQLSSKVADNEAWRAERPGQATIARAELVGFVRRILEAPPMSLSREQAVPPEVLARVRAPFEAFGGAWVDAAVLQPLGLLLDLAGEAMRARLLVVQSEGAEDAALRPDFTIPVVQAHEASGGTNGRYLYEGRAFVAPQGPDGVAEFLQIGAESFGPSVDAPAEDAEVAALAWSASLAGGRKDLAMTLGDVGLFAAFIRVLGISETVAGKLVRAFSDGRNLPAELARAQGAGSRGSGGSSRLASLLSGLPEAEAAAVLEELWRLAGIQPVGGRSPAEIVHRLSQRSEGVGGAGVSAAEAELIGRYLAISAAPRAALDQVEKLAWEAKVEFDIQLAPWMARLKALVAAGVPEAALTLSTGFSRPFGYYDGVLFEVRSAALGSDRPLAAGGRYDGLPVRLNGAGEAGAVGCMVRPARAWAGAAA